MSTIRRGFLNGVGFVLGYYVAGYALALVSRRLLTPEPIKTTDW